MRKKILIVSYHFPPDLSVGAIRPFTFAKYLPAFGYTPFVLTAKEKYHAAVDAKADPEIKEIKTYKTFKIPGIRDVYLFLKNLFKGIKKDNCVDGPGSWVPLEYKKHEKIIDRIKRYICSFIWLPDDKNGWILPVVICGIKLIKKHKIDAILTTSPPGSVLWAGLMVKIFTKKPWIADFRDPFGLDTKPFFIRSKLSDFIEKWINRKIIKNADLVITTTPEMTEALTRQYPQLQKNKFRTILNGYDQSELGRFLTVQKYEKFTITYAGTLYMKRNPRTLLSAVSKLIKEGRIGRDEINIRFLGNCQYVISTGEPLKRMIEELNLVNVVSIDCITSRVEALEIMARSRILFLFSVDQPLQIPVKLYEYIGLHSYVLAECDEAGAALNILRQYPRSEIVPPGNIEKMKEAIIKLFNARNDRSADNLSSFQFSKFERKELAGQLAEALNKRLVS